MDKIKSLLRTVKRLHFWLICPLIVILGLVAWMLTVGWLKKDADQKRQAINGLYSTLDQIKNEYPHPNQVVHDGMEQLINKRRQEVAQAWTEKWDQQTSEDGILTWPREELLKYDWGAGFLREVEHLRPIEKKVPFPLDSDLLITMRRGYGDYIRDELPKLAEMIGAVWSLGERGPGARRRTSETSVSDQSIVSWNPANQKEIWQDHFVWTETGPSTSLGGEPNKLDILYAQEDLWVLRSIMKIIQRTNDGATTRFNAAVKEIDFIQIGKAASVPRGQISQMTATAEVDTMPGLLGGPPPPSAIEEPGGEFGPDGLSRGPGSADPAEGRYVDKDYQPLDAARLRQVMTAESVEPADAYLAVAKRVPVRMRLKIDQTKLNLLLVQCANAALTVEVRQLRINPNDSRASQTSGGFGGRRGGGPPQDGSFRMMQRENDPSRRGGSRNDESSGDAFNYNITVELYGIVYLYNPVDNKILGIEQGEGGLETVDSVAAAN